MEKKYKNCQSCRMPRKQDPQVGGINSDGSKSLMYCSYCYQNGVFTQPDFTAQQMKEFCIEKMVEMKIPRLAAKFLAIGIPRLERWRK
jgi:hypothetical protein